MDWPDGLIYSQQDNMACNCISRASGVSYIVTGTLYSYL